MSEQRKPLKQRHNSSKVATVIRNYMNKHKLTFEEFAALLAKTRWQCRLCTNVNVVHWMNGRMPSAYYIAAIMQVCEITDFNDLFEDTPGSGTIR